MDIQFKIGDLQYKGTVTTVPKETETQYFLDLGESLKFTIRHEDGCWETDNPDIEPEVVSAAGDAVEGMDLSD
jgi:hypothetical protein